MTDGDNHDLVLHLPILTSSVTAGRHAARDFASRAGCSDAVLWRVSLAVSEALSNVVVHAHRDGSQAEHELVLRADRGDHRLQISVEDHGVGMRPRDDSPGLGRGLDLMVRVSDGITIKRGPHGGTVVAMTFLSGSG